MCSYFYTAQGGLLEGPIVVWITRSSLCPGAKPVLRRALQGVHSFFKALGTHFIP